MKETVELDCLFVAESERGLCVEVEDGRHVWFSRKTVEAFERGNHGTDRIEVPLYVAFERGLI